MKTYKQLIWEAAWRQARGIANGNPYCNWEWKGHAGILRQAKQLLAAR